MHPDDLKSHIEKLPEKERGLFFHNCVEELYKGNGWIVARIENRNNSDIDILLSHPSSPDKILLITKIRASLYPISLEEAKKELVRFEKQKSKIYKCNQFNIISIGGFENSVKNLSRFNLLLSDWEYIQELLFNYNPKKIAKPEIELFAHNKATYLKVKELWKKHKAVSVVQATGTGKSFLIAKLLNDFKDQKKLVMAPSNYILDQIKEHIPWENTSTIFMTYAKSMYLSFKEIEKMNLQLIILDEFHRCGAIEWGRGVKNISNAYPNAYKFGASATPVRYLDNSRDMSIELFEGRTAENLNLAQAIVKRILPMPKYISALYTLDSETKILKEKVEKSNRSQKTKQELYLEIDSIKIDWEKTSGIPKILKKHINPRMNKFIVFCESELHLNEMQETVKEWFVLAGITKPIKIYRILNSEVESDRNLEYFKSGDSKKHIHLLFSINMLNEGLHLKEVNAVILLRPTESPNIFYQQIGRCLQVGMNDTPVIFDFVNNFKSIRAKYFTGDLEFIRFQEEKVRKELGLEEISPKFTLIDEVREISEIFGKITFSLANWEAMYERLILYKKRHGNCSVPSHWEEDLRLANWVGTQRKLYKRDLLSEERLKKLNNISFEWDPFDGNWESRFNELKESLGRGIKIQELSNINKTLTNWIHTQRQRYKKGELPSDKIKKLKRIGLELNPKEKFEEAWNEKFEELKAYKKINGDCQVSPFKGKYKDLMIWMKNQRQMYKKDILSRDRIKLLQSIGFEWDYSRRDEIWEKKFTELKFYYSKHGHCNISPNDLKNQILYNWVKLQRNNYKKNLLSSDRVKKLKKINFQWVYSELNELWEEKFYQFKEYQKKYNAIKLATFDKSLADWVAMQRRQFKKGNLSIDRIEKLERIGFRWNLSNKFDELWERRFSELKLYKKKYGNCDVPQNYINKQLANWIGKQRQNYSKETLSNDKIKNLEKLGFKWQLLEGAWQDNFNKLKELKKNNGDFYFLKNRKKYLSLINWINDQRKSYSKNILVEERIKKLQSLGFSFEKVSSVDKIWNERFSELKSYKRKFGDCNVPARWDKNKSLANWVHFQRQKYKKGKLAKEKIKILNDIKFIW